MTLRRKLEVTRDDRIAGLTVIAFQGAVDPAYTPAHCAAVLVDAEHCLSRVADFRSEQDRTYALVDSVGPPLPLEGALPGVTTRLGPFPAMPDGVVAVVGRSERPLVYKMDVDRPDLPARVAEFLRWLRATSRSRPTPPSTAQVKGSGQVTSRFAIASRSGRRCTTKSFDLSGRPCGPRIPRG
jgi:hypothetical protein